LEPMVIDGSCAEEAPHYPAELWPAFLMLREESEYKPTKNPAWPCNDQADDEKGSEQERRNN